MSPHAVALIASTSHGLYGGPDVAAPLLTESHSGRWVRTLPCGLGFATCIVNHRPINVSISQDSCPRPMVRAGGGLTNTLGAVPRGGCLWLMKGPGPGFMSAPWPGPTGTLCPRGHRGGCTKPASCLGSDVFPSTPGSQAGGEVGARSWPECSPRGQATLPDPCPPCRSRCGGEGC